MSLSWLDATRVALAPDRLVLARVGGLRPAFKGGTVLPVAAAGETPWQGAIDALGAALKDWGRPGAVTVILSNHFVRYSLVPWRDGLTSGEERAALARQVFETTYGERASGWTVRLDEGGWGRPGLAAAVDSGLLAALSALAAGAGFRLTSVQPYWVAAFNQFRASLPEAGCLAVAEAGRVCLGVFQAGAWEGFGTRRLARGESPLGPLRQELLALESANPPDDLLLYGAQAGDAVPWSGKLRALPLPAAGADYAMALAGLGGAAGTAGGPAPLAATGGAGR